MKMTAALAALTMLSAVATTANAAPTYTQDVAPILNENCVVCHRPKDIAPMSLLTYDEVRPWAKSIVRNVEERIMPPWHADPGFGPWKNERSLTDEEIETIVEWANAGAPRGSKADAPPVPEFDNDGWRLGDPDKILTLDEVEIEGDGPDRFYDLVVPTGLEEDTWVTAIEILPGNREVVHHVIVWKLESGDRGGQGWLGAWAAGGDPFVFPEGTGRMLKAGSSLIGDMHYHPTGVDAVDQTQIGLHFASAEDIEKELVNLWVMNDSFAIPAGDSNYQATSTYKFQQDSHLYSLTPHMHYRGKDFNFTLTYPDGSSEELLAVSKYDFNWQTVYEFEEPMAVPAGSRIDCVAHWDNSADNPANPDPTKTVTFGPESYDEMMIGFVDFVVDEGVRPRADLNPMDPKIEELHALDPGYVFELTIPFDGSMQKTALHVPPTGDGGWYVPFAGQVARAPVIDIVWNGNTFTAIAQIPDGENKLEGILNTEAGTLTVKMTDPSGRTFPVPGRIANP